MAQYRIYRKSDREKLPLNGDTAIDTATNICVGDSISYDGKEYKVLEVVHHIGGPVITDLHVEPVKPNVNK